jgi:hypothetical protein
MLRSTILAVLLALFGAFITAAPAQASEGVIWMNNGSWKDCQHRTARVQTNGQFDAWDYGGRGTYYIKWKLKWQNYRIGGLWRGLETISGTGPKLKVTAPNQVVYARIADKTNLANAYVTDWRVWIRITLYKKKVGPDKRWLRDRIEKSYYKPRFRETGGLCSLHP